MRNKILDATCVDERASSYGTPADLITTMYHKPRHVYLDI